MDIAKTNAYLYIQVGDVKPFRFTYYLNIIVIVMNQVHSLDHANIGNVVQYITKPEQHMNVIKRI